MTVHAVIESAEQLDEVITRLKQVASEAGISHSTIEAETKECSCPDCGIIAND